MGIINQLQSGFDQIRQSLRGIDKPSFLESLPSVVIKDEDVYQALPPRTPAVYFLTHFALGLLYVGKAKQIRQRWAFNAYQQHACHEIALRTENVKLIWWEIPIGLIGVVEEILIEEWKPKWNGQGSGKTRMRREAIDAAWEERRKGSDDAENHQETFGAAAQAGD